MASKWTEEQRIEFVKSVPVGRLFRTHWNESKYPQDGAPYYDVYHKKTKDTIERVFDGVEICIDYDESFHVDSGWGGETSDFRILSETNSIRLMAIYAMDEKLFVEECKALGPHWKVRDHEEA